MPDRERLLKAVEFCRNNARCDGCPYDGECSTRDSAIENDTLALLRELEPTLVYCPNCGAAVEVKNNA